nr:MAG TPA: Head Tail Connector Protein [Caudoviricetes sp.]
MTSAEKLSVLKNDLQLMSNANDLFLSLLLEQAAEAIKQEGIILNESIQSDMIIISYAAYLFRKRAGTDTAMPKFLRYQLNNLLFGQKAVVK